MQIPFLVRYIPISALLIVLLASPVYAVQYTKPVDTTMVDGIKIQSPTRVQAGKPFQVKLVSKKVKINGICWWEFEGSKGVTVSGDYKMKNSTAIAKVLPLQPGAARVSFACGTNRSNMMAGGSHDFYIAP